MTWQQIAISAPIIFIFAFFTLQLIKLNNRQTNAFLARIEALQKENAAALAIWAGQNTALIQALHAIDASDKTDRSALLAALQCMSGQITMLANILLKHDIRSATHAANLATHLNIPAPTGVTEAWLAMAATPPTEHPNRKPRSHDQPKTPPA